MNQVLSYSRREGFIYLSAIIASIVLSLWLACRESVINPDAICYLLSAQAVGSSGIRGAMNLCGQASWPFYSTLIYLFTSFSHLSFTVSAYTLDAVFSCISVTAFILIVKEMGATKRVMWLAALVILCSHEFISTREYIVRDHGYWAFYLAALFFLLRHVRQPNVMTALAWSASLLTAALFRIEGVFFLLILPFTVWFMKGWALRQRAQDFFLLNLPTIVIGAVITGWMLLHPAHTLDKLGRLAEVSTQFRHGLGMMVDRYLSMKASLAQNVLSADSANQAGLVLVLMMLSWYLVSVIGNLSWIYALLVAYAWTGDETMPSPRPSPASGREGVSSPQQSLVLSACVLMNIIITLSFLTEHLFLSKRYLIALSLTLMLWAPFGLNMLIEKSLIEKAGSLRHRLLLWLTALCMTAAAVSGIVDFGYSKAYIRQAGEWLAVNSPANAAIYANDYQLMYYSQHFGFDIFTRAKMYSQISTIEHGAWKQYDYLALRLDKKDEDAASAVLKEMHIAPVQVFSNKRGDRVAIYKVLKGDVI